MKHRNQSGFTLLEMAIVLAIFGLVASGGMLAATAFMEKAAVAKTKKNLNKIEDAITVFVLQHGYLPCPYNKYDITSGACVTTSDPASPANFGIAPYLDLGLQRNEIMDGWNRYITYVADTAFTPDTGTPMACGSVAYTAINSLPSIAVMDTNGNAPSDLGAYVLISHGKNGFGAYMSETVNYGGRPPAGAGTEELQNSVSGSNPDDFYYEPINNIGFDDIIRSRSPARTLYDGGCPSA